MRSLLASARKAKVTTARLHVIWDFTVGSRKSLESPLLKMRDDAFAQLGDRNLADLKVDGAPPVLPGRERRGVHAGAERISSCGA